MTVVASSDLLIVDAPQPLDPRGSWVCDRQVFLNAAGQVCDAKDPDRKTIYAQPRDLIPWATAERLGLASAPPVAAAPPIVGTPPRLAHRPGSRAAAPTAAAATPDLKPVTAPKQSRRSGR
jgi:hypothetical protein